MYGYPKRVWNAVAGQVFVGVATNESVPGYNCYPEVPATSIVDVLQARADRTLEELLTPRPSAEGLEPGTAQDSMGEK
ncbi:MAG: hypothetical protein KAI47_28440 [Deltaproteobacteria bacterium]|nr:hypothetical protein [Deltaproteobacteria bacterium]